MSKRMTKGWAEVGMTNEMWVTHDRNKNQQHFR